MRGYRGQKCQKCIIFSHPHVRDMAIGGSMSNSVLLQDRSQTCKPTHQQNNGASPYVAAKQLLDIIQEFPISLFVPCNHDLYIHSSLPEGHEHHGLLKYLPGKEGVWISSLTTIRQASPDKDTWIFDTQMPLHPIMVQSQDVWQDVPDGLNRHSAQGGAATGQSQVAIIRCRSSWDCTE
jgi:hypothetical protein